MIESVICFVVFAAAVATAVVTISANACVYHVARIKSHFTTSSGNNVQVLRRRYFIERKKKRIAGTVTTVHAFSFVLF